MANQAKSKIFWKGQLLHEISEPQISANNPAETEPIRGMSPTDEPIGWREGQKPDYTITFTAPVMDTGSQEVDWDTEAANQAEGEFQIEKGSTGIVHSYTSRVVSCEETIDAGRNAVWNVTLRATVRRRIG